MVELATVDGAPDTVLAYVEVKGFAFFGGNGELAGAIFELACPALVFKAEVAALEHGLSGNVGGFGSSFDLEGEGAAYSGGIYAGKGSGGVEEAIKGATGGKGCVSGWVTEEGGRVSIAIVVVVTVITIIVVVTTGACQPLGVDGVAVGGSDYTLVTQAFTALGVTPPAVKLIVIAVRGW